MSEAASIARPGVYVSIQELIDWRHLTLRQSSPERLNTLFELPGSKRSSSKGHGTEFSEMRAWQSADGSRSIDWRVSARRGELTIRQHLDERERPLYCLVDQRPGMFFGSGERFKSVTAAHAAALLAWAALAAGDRLGGLVFGTGLSQQPCAKGQHNLLQWLQKLVIANQSLNAVCQSRFGIGDALDAAIAAVPLGARVTMISDFDDPDWQLLGELAARTRLALLIVADPLEREFQLRGNLAISDGSGSRAIRFDRRLLEQYRATRASADERLRQWCEDSLVALHQLSTDQSVDVSLNVAEQGSLPDGVRH